MAIHFRQLGTDVPASTFDETDPPGRINGFPVEVALRDRVRPGGVPTWVVAVRRPLGQNARDSHPCVVWRVFRNNRGEWCAEHGDYDLTLDEAHERAKERWQR